MCSLFLKTDWRLILKVSEIVVRASAWLIGLMVEQIVGSFGRGNEPSVTIK